MIQKLQIKLGSAHQDPALRAPIPFLLLLSFLPSFNRRLCLPLLLITAERLLRTLSGEVEIPDDRILQRLQALQSFRPRGCVLQ